MQFLSTHTILGKNTNLEFKTLSGTNYIGSRSFYLVFKKIFVMLFIYLLIIN